MGRIIEIIPAGEVKEMGEIVRKAFTGVKKHDTRVSVFRKIRSKKEDCEDYPGLSVPRRADRAEAWEEWAEEVTDRESYPSHE